MKNNRVITLPELIRLKPCWLLGDKKEVAEKEKRLRGYAKKRERWSAIDVLQLPDSEVSAADRMWLAGYLIDDYLLFEFALSWLEFKCRENNVQDKRLSDAIMAKRAWIKNKESDELGREVKEKTHVVFEAHRFEFKSGDIKKKIFVSVDVVCKSLDGREAAISVMQVCEPNAPIKMLLAMLKKQYD